MWVLRDLYVGLNVNKTLFRKTDWSVSLNVYFSRATRHLDAESSEASRGETWRSLPWPFNLIRRAMSHPGRPTAMWIEKNVCVCACVSDCSTSVDLEWMRKMVYMAVLFGGYTVLLFLSCHRTSPRAWIRRISALYLCLYLCLSDALISNYRWLRPLVSDRKRHVRFNH